MNSSLDQEIAQLPKRLRFVFSPLVKRALGFAFAATGALFLFGMSAYHKILDPNPDHMQHLFLLTNFLRGYNPETWAGIFIGSLWMLWTGFVLGWFTAAVRNFFVAIWIIVIRTQANLKANRDFLDHI